MNNCGGLQVGTVVEMAVGSITHRNGVPGSWSRAALVAGLVALLAVAACSGSDDTPVASANVSGSEPAFDPNNPDGTDPPVPGTAVQLGDDVIIATEDGLVPTPTTEPPTDPDGPDAPPAADATTTTAAPIPLPAPANIGRIVSMSATHTETLFALGLGEFVVAVDSESDFPEAAVALRRDELRADRFEVDSILALAPDVVIIGDDPTGLAGRLNENGVASFSGPPAKSLDDVYAQIRGISAIVGRPDLGDDLVASMQAAIAATIASLPNTSARKYFHEIDPSLVTITPGSFLDSVYGELGLVSIAPADVSGFAQMTSQQVVSANPAVVILADAECCAVNVDVLAKRPGWSGVSAVSNGAVVEVQDYMVSRWGPRVVELVERVAAGVASAA